jgi:NagD protein
VRRFLVLTNNSIFTARDLRARLLASGLDVPEESIWTSALATAQFLDQQLPRGSAYVIGEAGLTTALHEIGYVLTDTDRTTWCSGRPGRTRSRRSPRRSG